jgi:hypothetical protein
VRGGARAEVEAAVDGVGLDPPGRVAVVQRPANGPAVRGQQQAQHGQTYVVGHPEGAPAGPTSQAAAPAPSPLTTKP